MAAPPPDSPPTNSHPHAHTGLGLFGSYFHPPPPPSPTPPPQTHPHEPDNSLPPFPPSARHPNSIVSFIDSNPHSGADPTVPNFVSHPYNLNSAAYLTTNGGNEVASAPPPPPAMVVEEAVVVKRKRGRPRKYDKGGATTPSRRSLLPSSAVAAAAAKERKKGFSSKKYQLSALGAAGQNFTPHVLTIAAGEDISAHIITFTSHAPWTVCILSANGAVSNAMLRHTGVSGGVVTYEGRFEILCLSGSFLLSEGDGTCSRIGGLSISLAGPDGRVFGGGVAGLLIAATPVQVVVGTFFTTAQKNTEKIEASSGIKGAALGTPGDPSTFSLMQHMCIYGMESTEDHMIEGTPGDDEENTCTFGSEPSRTIAWDGNTTGRNDSKLSSTLELDV